MRPVPPGEILIEEFLQPPGLTASARAKAICATPKGDAGEGEKEDRTKQERAGELEPSDANKKCKVMI